MAISRGGGSLLAAVAVLAPLVTCSIPAPEAHAASWNQREGYYLEEFEDTSGLDLIQAVSVDVPTTSIGVTPGWIWAQPGPSATYLTDTKFSAAATATTYVQVVTATPYGEALQLFQRFYPAVTRMEWANDCASLNPASTKCLLYPVSAEGEEVLHGAKSEQVLLVPDIARFNSCQDSKACKGSGDYTIVSMNLYQDANQDLLVPGRSYNATWWLRSAGQHPNPPLTSAEYNDRMAGFVIGYTYTASGTIRTDYFGGATGGCSEIGTIGCLERSQGCPLHLLVSDPALPATLEGGAATPYLNTPGVPDESPYTPFSFSFAPGSLKGAGTPWDPKDCRTELLNGMNIAMCHDPPGGVWGFALNTLGTSSPPNSDNASMSCSIPAVPCKNSRAAASLFIDGLTLTAGRGVYQSPAFDSLSDKTRWTAISWNLDENPDAKGVRTPVQLSWRIANNTAGFQFSSTLSDGSVEPSTEIDRMDFAGPPVYGRYFQYRVGFSSWDECVSNPPPPKGSYGSCARYNMAYDGSLVPRVRQFSVAYQPDAGQLVSRVISPGRLWKWGQLSYRKDDASPGRVTCDVLDSAGGVIMADVASGTQLVNVDPGRYPSIRVRFTLARNGASVDPRVHWFRVYYDILKGCLALNRNAVRLSYGEDVAVRFCTTRAGMVDVTIHDVAGQLVKRLFHGELPVGDVCQKRWNGMSDPMGRPASSCALTDTNPQGVAVAPGLYFVTVTTPAGRDTARLAVLR